MLFECFFNISRDGSRNYPQVEQDKSVRGHRTNRSGVLSQRRGHYPTPALGVLGAHTYNELTPMPNAFDTFVQTNQPRFLDELKTFLTHSQRQHLAGAQTRRGEGRAIRRERARRLPVSKTSRSSRPRGIRWFTPTGCTHPASRRCCCYGHYDVQPPDPLELWDIAAVRTDRARRQSLRARLGRRQGPDVHAHQGRRGAARRAAARCPCNVKFLIEGEEEVGGESIAKYVPENKEKLKADVALVSDTELYAEGMPTLCIGLRGLIYTEIEARGPARDLHSGLYGGAAPNAVFGLVELLAKVKDARRRHSDPRHLRRRRSARAAEEIASWEQPALQRERVPEERSRLDAAHRRAGCIGARARVGAADARSPRHRRRIHGRGRQDGDSRQGDREGQHPPGAESGSGESHRRLQASSWPRIRRPESRPKSAC